jgi:hypothetical protein
VITEAKEQGTILCDRINRIYRIYFLLSGRERENSQSLRDSLSATRCPCGAVVPNS